MKFLFLLLIFSLHGLPAFAQTAASTSTAQAAPLYKLPDIMPQHIKTEYAKMCDKGLILYQINCGTCHTKQVDGKDVIPDFSIQQINDYELRVLNPKHESEIPETIVTPEELSLIMTFLTYKLKNEPAAP
jgi:mono/diheme cytochrome c family protein